MHRTKSSVTTRCVPGTLNEKRQSNGTLPHFSLLQVDLTAVDESGYLLFLQSIAALPLEYSVLLYSYRLGVHFDEPILARV